MYGLFGGCTTLLHLFVRHPILVLALGLSGFATQIPSSPGPGDRFGTGVSLNSLERKIVQDHPELVARVVQLRESFDRLYKEPTEGQINQVLKITDPCTDVKAESLTPDERREVAWILYLGNNGPPK